MSKSVLVVDTPEKCDDCNIRQINLAWCQVARKSTSHHPSGKPMDERKRPDWCPLKPMPEKMIYNVNMSLVSMGEMIGWNACIDAIIGDGKA